MATKIYNKEGEVASVQASRLQAYLEAGWSVTPIQSEVEPEPEPEIESSQAAQAAFSRMDRLQPKTVTEKEASKEKKKGKK